MPDDDTLGRAEELLSTVDLGDWEIIVEDVADELDDVYASGLAEGLRLTNMGVDLDQVNERAGAWARQSAASLVRMIEPTTRDLLRATVVDAIEQGWAAARLADEIAKSPAFGDDRAMTIARSELITAENQGNMRGYRDAANTGVRVMKEWLVGEDPCVVCQENADEGPIDLDDDFPSGDDCPAAHPRCECSVAPYLPDEEEEEEDEGQ